MKQEVKIGQTDYTVLILIRDTAGAPKTGLTNGSAGIDVCYTRVETDNDVVLTAGAPVALATPALTDPHLDWGFLEVDATNAPGLYRLDIADGVFATGAWSAVVSLICTGCDPTQIEFVLVPSSPYAGVPDVNVTKLLGTAPTESGAGRLAGAFTTFFDVATPVGTVNLIAANATQWLGQTIHAATVNGVPVVQLHDSTGTGGINAPANFEDLNITDTTGLVRPDMANASGNYAGTVATVTTLTTRTGFSLVQTGLDLVIAGTTFMVALADAVWDEATVGHAGAGTTGLALTSATAPSAATVADAVWDELITGHTGAGKTGALLSAAGTAADPWLTALPGAYVAGSAGFIIGHVSAAGAGAITWTYTVTDSGTGLPIGDVDVWVTTDIAGANVVASGKTTAAGVVTFYLDAGTYYVWRQKSGWTFVNPDCEVITP